MKYEDDCRYCQIYLDQYHSLERMLLGVGVYKRPILETMWAWIRRKRLPHLYYKGRDYDRDFKPAHDLAVAMMMTHHHYVRHNKYRRAT